MVMSLSWTLTVQCLKIPLSRNSAGPAFCRWGSPFKVTVSAWCNQEGRKVRGRVGRLHFLAKNSQHTLIHIFAFL